MEELALWFPKTDRWPSCLNLEDTGKFSKGGRVDETKSSPY